MRRSLERRQLPVSGLAPGEVLVASSFGHPARGTVRCPAAPVAATAMRASGLPVRHSPALAGTGAATMYTVSYVDPVGHAVGLGVAVHRDDERAVCLARQVVRDWADVMRTRRVQTAATGPSCTGLRREAEMIAQVAGPAYLLTAVTDRSDVPFRWPNRDVRLVERVADVPDNAIVVLPAHGVDPRVRADAAARGLRVIDATCPLVARTHATARRFADEGATVVLIGGTGHAATQPVTGQVPKATVVVTTREEVDNLVIDDPRLVAFVVSPGLPVEDAAVIAAHLRSRFARTIGQHPDEFCHAASDRRAAARVVAASSDLTLVLGAPTSTDTDELVATATATSTTVKRLDDVGQLRPEWLGPAASVGILVSTSARPDLAGELVEVLSGLGPLSVTRREVTTEVQHTAQDAAGQLIKAS
jgi:4-hydroxy-3-methylbut-2-enyl diphosphate reductase